jgi:hypothetical protein
MGVGVEVGAGVDFAVDRRGVWEDTRGFLPGRWSSPESSWGALLRGGTPSPDFDRGGPRSFRKLGSFATVRREDTRAASLTVFSDDGVR